jgi:hypothetical protein
MVPAGFVMVEALPLTAGGKIDRRALAGLEGKRLTSATTYEAPRNEVERHIVEIWQELLEAERVGIHDHFFFDHGGHSLLAIQFVARLAERTGVALGIRALFEAPTAAALAARLLPAWEAKRAARDAPASPATPKAVPPETDGLEDILARQRHMLTGWKGEQSSPDSLIFTVNASGRRRGLFWCFQGYRELRRLAAQLGPDQPVHGMRSGHLILKHTNPNIDTLAAHYAAEMDVLQPAGDFVIGGNCQGAGIAYAVAAALRRRERQVALLILMEETLFPPYDGPVALLLGRDSHLSPYRRPDPEIAPAELFKARFPGGFTIDIIDGAHGEFFDDLNVASLAEAITARLRQLAGNPREAV